jgi:selenocysteine lyase/cysteine desulfurase
MESIDFGWLHERGEKLTRMLWDGLTSIKGVHVYGPPPSKPRTPTVSFTVDGMTSEEVARALVKRGIFASHGDFYAATVVRVLGVEGLVRIGCAAYTTEEEVERLLDAVRSIR